VGLICARARVLIKRNAEFAAATDTRKKYLESSELVVNVKKMVAFLFFFYILQIPTRGEHPADEHANDTTKGDASGEHGAEKCTLFALLRRISFFFARAV